MSDEQDKRDRAMSARVEAEIADSFDEELEMELDDNRLARLLDGKDHDGNGLSDVTLLDPSGGPASAAFLDDERSHFVALRIDGEEAKDVARSLLVAYDWSASPIDMTLPTPKGGMSWYLAAHSDLGLAFEPGSESLLAATTLHLPPRTAVILVER